MIRITDKKQCCGCGACIQKCPRQSISLYEDNEGFLYPKVNTATCIDCGLCEMVCPILNQYEVREPIQVLAAFNKDEKTRMESSSGGLFTLLAESVIRESGVVFGARFDDDWQVILDYTETHDGLAAFRGSKYVQASTGNTYKQCEKFLKEGRRVLFSGTPCQITGLHRFLRKEYENLITCDFICHGVPSPKVWSRYLKEVTGNAKETITNIKFRAKDNGWKHYNTKLSFTYEGNTTTISSSHRDNIYMRAFLHDLILRPSCYDCKAKQGRSMSDITLADFWGIQNTHPEMDDDKGTGLIILHTEKGRSLLDWNKVKSIEVNYNDAVPYNGGFKLSVPVHHKRTLFFEKLDTKNNLKGWITVCVRPSAKQRIKYYICSFMRIIRLIK